MSQETIPPVNFSAMTIDAFHSSENNFSLGIPGFYYSDLYDAARLAELTTTFYQRVAINDAELWQAWQPYLASAGKDPALSDKQISGLIVSMAQHLGLFLAEAFNLSSEVARLQEKTANQKLIMQLKRQFIQRAMKRYSAEQVQQVEPQSLQQQCELLQERCFPDTEWEVDTELGFARMINELLNWEKEYEKAFAKTPIPVNPLTRTKIAILQQQLIEEPSLNSLLTENSLTPAEQPLPDPFEAELRQEQKLLKRVLNLLELWSVVRYHHPNLRPSIQDWVAYHHPEHLDYQQLVTLQRPRAVDLPEMLQGPEKTLRRRDGFKLTDPRYNFKQVYNEVDYCLYCHERDKDSCNKGFIEKDGRYRKNPLGIPLKGCPLDEKISEAHLLKRDGHSLGALATIIIDNPMLPGTGHRICNDCMKSCIFQKQEPVNIPQIETGILTDILQMPYGYEIYSLLTRWNPLNVRRPQMQPYNGKNVLVVGLGPAGYTLSHYLLNEGFGVVGIDGLKIEPLPSELTGGATSLPAPIKNVQELYSDLDNRILRGFGGVSEYGITVRWDKNFLTLIYLNLARRRHWRLYPGVRFGGTLTIEDAWELGFDHIAIATGAGKPTIVPMKNNLLRGIRKASDFLMALQLTGAYKASAMANLQVQLPAIVIGGGLTAIDTATELVAYYPVQVEKTLQRYEKLVAENGERAFWAIFEEEERDILREFIDHGRQVRAERQRAQAADEAPDFVALVRSWGGVSIAYRKRLQDAPAYRLNHEEVVKALEEGISFVENVSPVEAIAGHYGAVAALKFERYQIDETGQQVATGEHVILPAKSVCVAAGTSPNIIYEREYPGTFELDKRGQFFAGYQAIVTPEGAVTLAPATTADQAFFTSYQKSGRVISYYGDNHPAYAGNVVKAMASAKQGYPHITRIFAPSIANLSPDTQPLREAAFKQFTSQLDDLLLATVVKVERLTPTIVDVVVRAPLAARKFQPGQFYRLQNFEVDSELIDNTKLLLEGLALTGAWVDTEKGWLSMIVLEMGVSSRLCASLQPGQQVLVMGPTGTPTEIPHNEKVLLAGGGLGNAVLFSIAKALKAAHNQVVYFAGYKKAADLFKREEIEASTDQVIWSVDNGEMIPANRPQDSSFRGNILQAMAAYNAQELAAPILNFCDVDRIIAIGSDRMMAAVKTARHERFRDTFPPQHVAIGSINSPMQCMMKEVCAQCLQRHVDPKTGAESFVFSCFNQDQLLDCVDFTNLNARLRTNSVQEKLANLWFDHLITQKSVLLV